MRRLSCNTNKRAAGPQNVLHCIDARKNN